MKFATIVTISAAVAMVSSILTVAALACLYTDGPEECERCKARSEDGTDEPVLFLLGPTDYSESRSDQKPTRSH